MSTVAPKKFLTLAEALIAKLREQALGSEYEAAPVAILWPDADRDWAPLIPNLQSLMPELFCLGPYDPSARSGPAIWLRCVVDRALPDVDLPENAVPVIYLPGVQRQELRQGSDCRNAWQPLIELQFRGKVWHHSNGRDWTVEAFASSVFQLDIRRDERTREALRNALPELVGMNLDGLRDRHLEAEDFYQLSTPDAVRELLLWMNDPAAFQQSHNSNQLTSFRAQCRTKFGFNPEDDSPSDAAALLVSNEPAWAQLWQRFSENPRLYAGVSRLLRQSGIKPDENVPLFSDPSRFPSINERDEKKLLKELEAAADLPQAEASTRILKLEREHSPRRNWVWTQLGESPLAVTLESLAELARETVKPLTGMTAEAIAEYYTADGWRCDRAAMKAIAGVSVNAHISAIHRVVRSLYEPWLDQAARRLQEIVAKQDWAKRVMPLPAENRTVILFADGLRMDVGRMLQANLEARGLHVAFNHRFGPIPSVTPTAKPVASPAVNAISGLETDGDFCPSWKITGRAVNAPGLREELSSRGMAIVDPAEPAGPLGDQAGWVEFGQIDQRGHSMGAELASHLEQEVSRLAAFVAELLEAGWQRIRIVTDHGWLLLPGGLPKVMIPPSVVETKWSRCALVSGDSRPEVPVYPWHWNPHVRIACPPGIGAFKASTEYSHGGISPQELVVPDMMVQQGADSVTATIVQIQWRGMRCRIRVQTNDQKARVDIRTNASRPETSVVANVKEIGADGEVNLAASDEKEGDSATVVVIDSTGRVLARQNTTIGEA
jgi:hypothetical protein